VEPGAFHGLDAVVGDHQRGVLKILAGSGVKQVARANVGQRRGRGLGGLGDRAGKEDGENSNGKNGSQGSPFF